MNSSADFRSSAEHEAGADFHCPSCEISLKVAVLPEVGPCPACGEPLSILVSRHHPRGRIREWAPWIISIVLLLVVIGLVAIWLRADSPGLGIRAYDPKLNNRFSEWPWPRKHNPSCIVPGSALSGIGWDENGGAHALVDPSFIVITHNTPPRKVHFLDVKGRIWKRDVTSSHTLCSDPQGRPWIRICGLDHPLPDTVKPLPILDVSSSERLDMPLFMVGRHGAVGCESVGSVHVWSRVSKRFNNIEFMRCLYTASRHALEGSVMLRPGDSGSPLIASVEGGYSLVGLAGAVCRGRRGGAAGDVHMHVMLSPQIPSMERAGALPRLAGTSSPNDMAAAKR